MIRRDGEATYLPLQGSMPLGVSGLARYRSEVHAFESEATLVLYTDGLVESPGKSIDDGLERLRGLAARGGTTDALCARLVAQLVPEQRRDDVAILAARVPSLPERLGRSWPADRRSLAQIRLVLRRWLRARGATDDEVYDIIVACQEACSNAIEHAYGPGRHSFDVQATCEERHVRLRVADHGRWRAPRGTNRGRGMPMMERLMDRVTLDRADDGTHVVLERTLRGQGS